MTDSITTRTTTTAAPVPTCVRLPAVFQDPLLEGLPTGGAPAEDRRRAADLVATAAAACGSCPLAASCLYRAVVEHDVAGFVAGTTPRQRAEIRRRLGVVVHPEDFDTLAGVVRGGRQVDHEEVLRLRAAHPDESLETLAGRLGCSLSTVKRHLRRARTAPSPSPSPVRTGRPHLRDVLVVAAQVTAGSRSFSRAA